MDMKNKLDWEVVPVEHKRNCTFRLNSDCRHFIDAISSNYGLSQSQVVQIAVTFLFRIVNDDCLSVSYSDFQDSLNYLRM